MESWEVWALVLRKEMKQVQVVRTELRLGSRDEGESIFRLKSMR